MKERKIPEEILEDFIPDHIDRNEGYGYYSPYQVYEVSRQYAAQETEIARQEERVKLISSMGDHYNEGYEYGVKEERDRHADIVGLIKLISENRSNLWIDHIREAAADALKQAGYLERKEEQK